MPVITNRAKSLEIAEKAAVNGTSIAIFGTASHWNTEAILMAAQRIADKYELEYVPVVVSSTFTYGVSAYYSRMSENDAVADSSIRGNDVFPFNQQGLYLSAERVVRYHTQFDIGCIVEINHFRFPILNDYVDFLHLSPSAFLPTFYHI
jgi:hypothetical protein